MDPSAPTSLDDMMTETEDDELERIKERVRGRGADWKKPASPEAGKAALLALIEEMARRLEVKLSRHRERQEFEKSMQTDLLAFDDSHEGELARRYQLAKDREMHRAINALLKVRKEARAAAEAGWPLADCIDGGAEVAPAGVEEAMGFGDETKPTPPGPVLESRLEAADPVGIPAEAGTPTIQPPESGPRAEEVIGTGDETKPNPPSRPGDETKPNPPEPAAAIGAGPAIRKAGQPTPEEYMAGLVARLDPSHPQSAMYIEALRATREAVDVVILSLVSDPSRASRGWSAPTDDRRRRFALCRRFAFHVHCLEDARSRSQRRTARSPPLAEGEM